ncbi:caspase family protein [Bradyrhizobium diazoefficiens]|uniref:caspase family protein n=1 Tax=Bradyrhizobium diazoefficiens TaxID=1355477 RepID=UPI001FF04015|nr:caspase family protein [Bradyrhizobium diazoefficiens]
MGVFRFLLFSLFLVWFGCGSAFAEKRIALVIGNSAYKSVPRLINPVNDAALVGGMFKNAGFDWIDIKTDLSASEMRKALREFGGRAREAEVAVIYYAGHGIELDGTNYLIPTDASLETDSDVLDETVGLDRALFAVEPAKQLRLIILDACRDNPFAKTMRRTVAARAIGRGLAKIEPTSPNTMIAFAAKAGSTASDGDSKNSPFATALVERLPTPGLDLRKAFGFIRDDVLKNTGYKQEPYVYGSLGGDDVSLVPAKPVAIGPPANPDNEIRRDYELALQLGTREGWAAFLNLFPSGFYAELAKGQLKKIAAEETRAAAANKARQAEEEKTRLAAERARKAEQDKAAAAAKAAEDARLAAEKAKQIEDAKAAAAEQRRLDAEAAIAKALAEKQAADKLAADKAETEAAAKQAAEKEVGKGTEQNVAAVAPASTPSAMSPQETTRLVQLELRRVGCLADAADGDWNAASQRSLTRFNKYAGTKFDAKLASLEALGAIKARTGRVCPPVCERGFEPIGDRCVRLTCRGGQTRDEKGECISRDRNERPARIPDRPLASRPETMDSKSTERRSSSGGRCVSTSQRCALEIGGRCDPATGKWEYGRNGAGGNTQAFNACLGRTMAGRNH